MTTSAVLEPMSRPTCEAFLANESVGRLAVIIDGGPHIVPVNYVADGALIVFRTAPGTVLTEASLRKVAFEVDGLDEDRRTGWSVCVHGFGFEITGGLDPESRRLQQLFVNSWAPGGRERWFKIVPDSVTGRSLGPARAGQPLT